MVRTVKHKGREVRLACVQAASGWVAKAFVVGRRGNGMDAHQILDPAGEPCATLVDAEERAITLAMQWIDEDLP